MFPFGGELGISFKTFEKSQYRVDQYFKENGGKCCTLPGRVGENKYQKGSEQDKVQDFAEQLLWNRKQVVADEGRDCRNNKIYN